MNPHPAFHLLPTAVYGFFCFEILGRFTIKLSLARALIVTTGASRLSGRSRSFSYPPFDPFSVAYTEYRNANLWHIFLRITVKILLQTFPCRNQNSTFCSGRLRPAKLQHGTKNSSDSNDVSDMFSSFSLQTLCISWCCCLRLLVSVPLPVPYICLHQTLACIPTTQETLCSGLTLMVGKWLHAYSSTPFIF